jgi:hypothetical protein
MLRFHDLQDALRKLLLEKIDSGELTGMALAGKTGFRQAHISNFLNRKRGFSIEGMDRVLKVEELSVLDLVPAAEINARASIPPPREDDYANIFVVGPQHAAHPQIHAADVIEVVKFKQSVLRRLRASALGDRENWLRFVMLKPSRADCEAMSPRLAPGCTLLIDRHHNEVAPYRRGDHTMYAVLDDGETTVRYVECQDDLITLQPECRRAPCKVLYVPPGKESHDLIIGRVAHVSMEI